MSSILTSRQTSELHKAIVQYLAPLLETEDSAIFSKVCSVLNTEPDNNTVPQYLEKKWSTVLRLQKRILDLENEVSIYKQLMASSSMALTAGNNNGMSSVPGGKINWVPGAVARTYPTQSAQIINSVSVHPKLPLLVAGCADGSMVAWNLSSDDTALPQKSWNAHTRSIHRLKWSGKPVDLSGDSTAATTATKTTQYLLASCSSDLTIKIWATDSLKHVRTLTGHEHTVSSIAFSPTTGHHLYSVSRDRTVKIWDLATGYCISSFIGHSDWVRDLDVIAVNTTISGFVAKKSASLLGDFLVTCSNDQSVRLSHHSGTGLSMLLGHTHVVECVKFLPLISNPHIDKYLAQNMEKFPYLSDAIVKNPVYTETLGFKYCISAGRDNSLKLWLLPPPVLLPHRPPSPSVQNNAQGWHIIDLLGHQSWVKSVVIHPNGRFIISGADDKSIRIWDLATLVEQGTVACIKRLTAHEGFVNAVHFAPFEIPAETSAAESPEDALKIIEKAMRCLFVSAGTDNTVRLWQ